ncbi:uncharacterized protein LOC129582096 [Paramacrobiotus metropolitanus]|uniref:uncharacterized protein LOC129582096 n=1 Tax=Paramacrobiotus metropolitanus TaxID=2943436 RepID=UPI002445FBF5|nr:uncharacterized protein LOC129582096 [Paramacrobiotus metropolitanus]
MTTLHFLLLLFSKGSFITGTLYKMGSNVDLFMGFLFVSEAFQYQIFASGQILPPYAMLRCYSCLRPESPCSTPRDVKIVTCSPGTRFCYKLLTSSTLYLQKVAALENSTFHKRIVGPSGDCADQSLINSLWKYGLNTPECFKSYELTKTELSADNQSVSFRFQGQICFCHGERYPL